jgi:putative transposase
LDISRATLYRGLAKGEPSQAAPRPQSRRRSKRALSELEQQSVLTTLRSERFADHAPPQVYATLLDEGVYACSISTMYRLLRAQNEVRERRNQRTHPSYERPELLAARPNELWSWDITKLRGPTKWTYYSLYVILDVFSRFVVGWHVAYRESAALAEELIAQTYDKQRIEAGQLTIHADRGSAMTSKPVAFLLADLGVTKTHSRPHTSNDNPYSEAQFKTMKYRPDFPDRFTSIEDARGFARSFFDWYNREHRHSGLALLTPEAVHYGRTRAVMTLRQSVLTAAYAAHPERFVLKQPEPPALPNAVWINPPAKGNDPLSKR